MIPAWALRLLVATLLLGPLLLARRRARARCAAAREPRRALDGRGRLPARCRSSLCALFAYLLGWLGIVAQRPG